MICPECNGKGEAIYYVETDRDENSVTVEQRKGICLTCNGSGVKPQTNADRIRAMSDEELAKWLLDVMRHNVDCFGEGAFEYSPCRNVEHDCVKCGVAWLQQHVEEKCENSRNSSV